MAQLTPSAAVAALAVAAMLLVAGCGLDEPAALDPTSSLPTTTTGAPAGEATATEESASSVTIGAVTEEGPCRTADTEVVGQVAAPGLIEISGLATGTDGDGTGGDGTAGDGVIWAHNDSGTVAGVAAFDRSGVDLGFHRLTGAEASDPEDLAIVGDVLVLGDIGDNVAGRDSIRFHLFAEPTPGTDSEIERFATVTAVYPDGPTDAEAMLVDPTTNTLVVLAKNERGASAPTRLYIAPLPSLADALDAADRGSPVRIELAAAGTVDLVSLEAEAGGFSPAALLFPGAATGADITPDGSVVVIRTYLGIWAFTRPPDSSVVDAFATEPCLLGRPPELQGEAVAIIAGGDGTPVEALTVGEGDAGTIHVSGR